MFNHFFVILCFICCCIPCFGQSSWNDVLQNKKGEIEISYYDSENFIIEKNGRLVGIEYDLLLAFFTFVEQKYGVQLKKKFTHAQSFGSLYDGIKNGKSGEFGACSFSMTKERLQEVNFSPRYMPDIEVMVCSKNFGIAEDTASFIRQFRHATALVVKNTTFEEDLKEIQKLIPSIKVKYTKTGVEILEKINTNNNYIGFSELPNYILSFEKGLKLKRQSLFRFERMGHGFIFPKNSDWQEPVEAFFNDPGFKPLMNIIMKKHLGNDIKDLLWVMDDDQTHNQNKEVNLLNKELEIQRIEIQKNELEAENQELIRNIFIVTILFVSVIAFFLVYVNRRNRKTNQILSAQKEEILNQKSIIEESNKNVIDSINYAKRIQESILPHRDLFSDLFPESFIFYKPKDIISGDFYFAGIPSVSERDVRIFAVGDCTGHGVPGALLTIIGNTFLQLSLKDKNINSCAEALNFLNVGLADILQADRKNIQDGMDIAMCAIHVKTMELEYAGGNNPCLVIRNGEIITLKPDKHGVGQLDRQGELLPFTNNMFQLQKNDTIYLFSDGYADQFGGPEADSGGKKFKISRLKELLLSIRDLSMEAQKQELEKAFHAWKGELEQVDDICLMGVRV
ncbi:MAG: SpoIIE family protein phosphatase [Bacteroidota bacterium]